MRDTKSALLGIGVVGTLEAAIIALESQGRATIKGFSERIVAKR